MDAHKESEGIDALCEVIGFAFYDELVDGPESNERPGIERFFKTGGHVYVGMPPSRIHDERRRWKFVRVWMTGHSSSRESSPGRKTLFTCPRRVLRGPIWVI